MNGIKISLDSEVSLALLPRRIPNKQEQLVIYPSETALKFVSRIMDQPNGPGKSSSFCLFLR
jgi:hypothetical protein